MKRESLVCILGVCLVVMPFMGIPSTWKRGGYVAIGMLLALIGYQLRRVAYLRSIEQENGERKTDVYAESMTPAQPTVAVAAEQMVSEPAVAEVPHEAPKGERKRVARTRRPRSKQTV